MYSDAHVTLACTGPATATPCRFLSRRVRQPVAIGCDRTPKYPRLFRPVALILGVASFLDGATLNSLQSHPVAVGCLGVRVGNSSSRTGLNHRSKNCSNIQYT